MISSTVSWAILDHAPPDVEHRILNIGDHRPIGLLRMIEILEEVLGQPAIRVMKPKQSGDVTAIYADITRLSELTGYSPKVPLEVGLARFADSTGDTIGTERSGAAALSAASLARLPEFARSRRLTQVGGAGPGSDFRS